MNCPQCGHPVEPGATFCGNCGFQMPVPQQMPPAQVMQSSVPQAPAVPGMAPAMPMPQAPQLPGVPIAQTFAQPMPGVPQPGVPGGVPLPAYAMPAAHKPGDTKAVLALVFGIISILAGPFIALLGLVLAITAIVMGTLSRQSNKKGMSLAGIILGGLGVVVAFATYAYIFTHLDQINGHSKASSSSSSALASSVTTPCYDLQFASTTSLKVDHDTSSCSFKAYDGTTADNSTELYVVSATNIPRETAADFNSGVKNAIEKDIKANLPSFTIGTEEASTFSGSPSFNVYASGGGISYVETGVFHETAEGSNVFILAHAVEGDKVNLNELEKEWNWK